MNSCVMYAERTAEGRKGMRLGDGTRTQPYLDHFFPTRYQVQMCSDSPQDIVRVLVTPDPAGSYWAWYDYDEGIAFVYFSRVLLETIFPYGSKVEEDRGRGKVIRVRVDET